MVMQFLKWMVSLTIGTAVTVLVLGASLLFSTIGAILGTISLGSGVILLVSLVIKEWWDSK